jgi:hypothetical protein
VDAIDSIAFAVAPSSDQGFFPPAAANLQNNPKHGQGKIDSQ